MQKITTFLTFESKALEAVNFYVSIFKNSKINNSMTIPATDQLAFASFNLDGEEFFAMDAGPDFKFEMGISLFVSCKDQEEVDYFWEKLGKGGSDLNCGWLKDKYGVSWQIIPDKLGELMQDEDPVKAQRVMEAMQKMDKIIIADLQKAYDNK